VDELRPISPVEVLVKDSPVGEAVKVPETVEVTIAVGSASLSL
jgi:hypothetical protein